VRKTFSASRLALCALSMLSLFGLRAYGQDRDSSETNDHPNGIVQDWSHRHVVYPRVGPIQSLIALQHDSRAILSWQAAIREDWHRARNPRRFHSVQSDVHTDWSISLGGGTTAPAMYPAKYTFDVNATPTCAVGTGVPIPDYIVYPVNVAGSITQPNIVAFNNLYSGTTPTAGLCNRAPSGNDTGIAATTFWSYNIQAAGGLGLVATSPSLSLDGTKVAFVETAAGTAHFHVLAWKSGDGVVANLQSVISPRTINSGFSATAPVAATGTVTDLTLGASSDTLSSPFIDYANDVAYIGDDTGTLFRVINVFCTNASCTSVGSPAPSLDPTWGAGGALATGCTGKLTGPVEAGNIFVGCSDGRLYGFTPAGAPIAGSPLIVGNSTATGGIVDPPMIDVVNGFAYVVSGNSAGGTQVLVQAGTTSFSSPTPVTATLGPGGLFSLHAPAFNEAYGASAFTSVANVQGTTSSNTSPGTISDWQILEWADSGVAGSPVTLYGVGFNGSHVMNSGAAGNFLQVSSSTSVEFSPVLQFMSGGTDRLYISGLADAPPNLFEYNLTNFPNLFPNVLMAINGSNAAGASTGEGSGTTGMVVDNVSASAQASSIYFGVLGPSGLNANSAVKLTQSGLN
jgi:hypothetical protein